MLFSLEYNIWLGLKLVKIKSSSESCTPSINIESNFVDKELWKARSLRYDKKSDEFC